MLCGVMDDHFECKNISGNVELIYGGQLRLSIKTPDKGDRRSSLFVCAEWHKTNSSPFRKELVVRLTDENDPFFYYQLKLTDEDYQSLRVQQGLLVDFSSFPQRFADLLEMCRMEEMNETPKFLLSFVASSGDGVGHLNVVETNPFKHLVHLSLRLAAGSDNDVKRHLAQRLTTLKGQNEKLRADIRSTESDLGQRLHDTRTLLSTRQAEVDELRMELREQAVLMKTKSEQQLEREQEKATEIHAELQSRYERELRECRSEHERIVRELRDSLTQAETRASKLGESRYGSETVIHDLRSRVTSLEEEIALTRRDLRDNLKEKKLLETNLDDAEANLRALSARTASLEQEVRSSESKAVELHIALDNAKDQNNKLTQETERRQSVLSKRETSVKTLAEEVNKGNEIIRKLQTEIKNLHSKLKLRNKVAEEQEKVIKENECMLNSMQEKLNLYMDDLKLRTEEVKKLQSSMDAAQTKLEENAKLMRTNENVINWLNKQLNESHVGGNQRTVGAQITGAPFNSPLVTSTPAVPGVPLAVLQGRSIVQYQPTQASVQVQMTSKRPPFDAIPEDPNSPQVGKENNAPLVMDPKYLQPNRVTQRSKGVTSTASSVRLPRMSVAPPNGKMHDTRWPGKSSAYFPS